MQILFADDDPVMTMLTKMALEKAGHEVRHCSNGADVLALLRTADYTPDLILTDFHMPGMNADAMVVELRTIPSYANTPIIVMSGSLLDEKALHSMDIVGAIDKTGNVMLLSDEIGRVMAAAGKIWP